MLPFLWGLFLWILFLFFQATGIYGGDSGDLVTAAYVGGIPHPPGYPLYSALGFFINHLPFSTVAWRMGLLSSLPHAATAAIVFVLVWRLTGRIASGLFASLVLVANYLFFLYSVTPEVFALLDLFLIGLTYLVYQKRYVWASFVLGLALSHHHVILFFIPVLLYWGFRFKKFILLGLLPYLYIPLAARGNAIINWDRAVDLKNFVRLLTREDYGTFVSSGFYGTNITERILQVKTYGTFLLLDFRWIGVLLALLGLVWLWGRKKTFGIGIILSIFFLGPVFYFYASFPLVNRFTLGTYERFLLPSYVFISLLMGFGLEHVIFWSKRVLHLRVWQSGITQFFFVAVFFIYPFTTLGITLWRFWGLRTDKTAENLALDILSSSPQNAILLMARDTQLFTTQYVRYGLGVRSDIKLLHSSRMPTPDYPEVIARAFPDIFVPNVRGEPFVTEFLKANVKRFPITSNTKLPVPSGWLWVPHGLVFLLTEESKVPLLTELIAQNDSLWSSYQNPENGILSRFNHLMLADVRGAYASSRIELGKTLVKAGSLTEAKKQFEAALDLGADTEQSDGFTYLGLAELFLKNCGSALLAFEKARGSSVTELAELTLYESQTYRDCIGDSTRADELLNQYEKKKKTSETPLNPKE